MRVLITLKRGSDLAAFVAALKSGGIAVTGLPNLSRVCRAELPAAAIEALPAALRAQVVAVDSADELRVKKSSQSITVGTDLTGGSWGLARIIRRSTPWDRSRLKLPISTYFECVLDGTGVDIYHFDTGIRTTHTEFGGRATDVYEFFSSGGAGDDEGHGTGTASCAVGSTVGIARGANILSFKCLDSSAVGSNLAITTAISEALSTYSGRSAPGVATFSIDGTGSAGAIDASIGDMIDAGIVVVAAAGNGGQSLASINEYPAESDADVIIAGATGPLDTPLFANGYDDPTKVNITNYGTEVDVSGPGQGLYMAINSSDSSYAVRSGTSFSTPFTAGVVACMLQGHSRLTDRTQVQAVKAQLIANATTGRIVNPAGWGITLPDALLYLDPTQTAPAPVSGL